MIDMLSPREQEVLDLMAQGNSNEAIASKLGIVSPTVERHSCGIYDKLGLHKNGLVNIRVKAVLIYLASASRPD